MKKVYAVDFESYYDAEISIGTMGVDRYCRETDIYLVSVVGPDGEEFVGSPQDFDWNLLVGHEIWSHNASFDRYCYRVLRERSVETVWESDDNGYTTGVTHEEGEWPDLETPLWNCTANLATFFRGGRSLKKAAKNLLGLELTKDTRDAMKGVKWAMAASMPSSQGFANFQEEIIAYAANDSKVCRQLAVQFGPRWPETEWRLSDLTTQGCHHGVPLDMEALRNGKTLLETKIWEVDQNLPWVTGIEGHMAGGMPALSPKGLAEACRVYNIPHPPSTAEDDARCILWENRYGADYPWVSDMRERRKANILLKRADVLLDREVDGMYRYELKYHGAHTGRWSGGREKEKAGDGGKGFNMQNLPKKPAFGFDLRACIKAPPGKKLIIADLSQIEARITPYLAGDDALIQLICDGMNVYEAHARLTMGYCINEKLKSSAPDLYALAKARVLALGFGCGWQRFRDQAQIEYGVGLDWAAAVWKQQVKDYRESNPKIVRLWNRLDIEFKESLGGDYEIELPSGRMLTYFDVSTGMKTTKVAEAKDTEPGEYTRQGFKARVEIGGTFKWMYGGLLTENLVQATARDVFGLALLRVQDERPDLTYLWPTHDEGVWLADEDDDTAKRDVEEMLCVTPDWLPGCPIGAEVVETLVYEK